MIWNFCPMNPDLGLDESLRLLQFDSLDTQQRIVVDNVIEAHMQLIATAKKDYPKETLGQIVGLISPFYDLLSFYFDSDGKWRK
jgi:hypothetical protein